MNRILALVCLCCWSIACAPQALEEDAGAAPRTEEDQARDDGHALRPEFRLVGGLEDLETERQRRRQELAVQPDTKKHALSVATLEACSSTSVCSTQSACLRARMDFEGGVLDYYDWYLVKNGTVYFLGSTSNDQSIGANIVSFPVTSSQYGTGSYSVIVDAYVYDFPSNGFTHQTAQTASISLTFAGVPTAAMSLNGQTGDQVEVCHGQPLTMNGSASTCTTGYFAAVQLSDASWNRYGAEYNRWLTSNDYANFGSIQQFNVNGYLGSFGQTFQPNEYYRVGLAVGPVWNSHTKLVYVRPSNASFTLNGQSTDNINVCQGSPLVLNGSASTCASNYLVTVQLSNASWDRFGTEYGRWLNAADYQAHGAISAFKVHGFFNAESNSQLQPGQYYRVLMATGTPWSGVTRLVYVVPKPTPPTSPSTVLTPNGSQWQVTMRWNATNPPGTKYKVNYTRIAPGGQVQVSWGSCLLPPNPSQPSRTVIVPTGGQLQWSVSACGDSSCDSAAVSGGSIPL